MDKVPLWFLIFYSIPESIILISFSATLYGYPIKKNIHRLLLLGVMLATSSIFVRGLPIKMGDQLFIEVPLFTVLTAIILRLSILKAIFYIITSFAIIIIGESISYPLISFITGLGTKYLSENIYLRMVTGWTHLTLIISLTVLIYKKKIKISWVSWKNKTVEARNQFILTSLLVGQVAIAGLLTFTINASVYKGWPIDNQVTTMLAGSALLAMLIISGILIKRIFAAREQAAILEGYEAFLDNINKLFTTVRGQRHDFVNHVQVIYSMYKTNHSKELDQYLHNLLEEIHIVNESIKVKNPVLNAILNAKTAVAEGRNINFDVQIQDEDLNTRVKPLDMVKILGNLIDNAMDAVENYPVNFRKVKVTFSKVPKGQAFIVSNLKPVLDKEKLEDIFKSGFTTKENHSGLGLAIVKQIVESYGGTINIKSTEKEGTVFTVVISDR
ncbi:MAG: GHKL domain-containing protein [Thermincola sp.]|jgi:signal transduction histidine kinase|nr:GHKL domain-containing protein [Thermincola sp.]MDT3701936.1 GHKL domain-containing protein [Thermincola sp.]